MKQVLYIDCCIRKDISRTKELASFFIDTLQQRSDINIHTLYLPNENLYLSPDIFALREKLIREKSFSHNIFQHAKDFAGFDKIIIAAPFWDLSFPALLKMYIEAVCVENITFACNATGIFGICKADHLVFITTRGGIYQNNPLEMGIPYIKAMTEFWGIKKFSSVVAEGLDLETENQHRILEQAKANAQNIAQSF